MKIGAHNWNMMSGSFVRRTEKGTGQSVRHLKTGTDFHILIWGGGVEKYLGGGCFFIKIVTVAFKWYI